MSAGTRKDRAGGRAAVVVAGTAEVAGMAGATLVDARTLSAVLRITERGVRLRAAAGKWPCVTRPVRGGRLKLYPLARLPAGVRDAVLAHHARLSAKAAGPAAARTAAETAVLTGALAGDGSAAGARPSQLEDWQRRCMLARAAILAHIRALARQGGLNAALRVVVAQAQAGVLPTDLAGLTPVANARAGRQGARTLSIPTLKRWWGRWKAAGFAAAALAPASTRSGPLVPAWGPAFLEAYRLPSKPAVTDALARMEPPPGVPRPSEGQARRFLARLSPVDRQRGRMGPAALKALRPFVRRDATALEPLDVVIADGFTAKHDVAHPIHGKPFAPELTVVRCVATRRVIGWSAGLSESTWTVMDAYADAARKAGLWAIAYTDNGAGFRSALNSGDLAGLQGRLGATHALGRPGNPQARGQIEKGWDRLFIRPAKVLPGYRGPGMDPEARRRIVKLVERDLKQAGRSDLLQSWAEFRAWAAQCVAAYNAAPHSGLPRLTDPATGKRRHMSPDEAWQTHLDRGWTPVRLAEGEAEDLFRPHLPRRVRRGEVSLFGARYFHADLEHHHGEEMQVGFDIHDPARVWVRTMSGVLVAVAEAGGNVKPYFDTVRVQRARRRLRPVEARRAEILAELDEGAAAIDLAATPETPCLPAPGDAGDRPAFFASDLALYAWCAAHPDRATAHDRAYLAAAVAGDARLARLIADHDRRHGGTGLDLTPGGRIGAPG